MQVHPKNIVGFCFQQTASASPQCQNLFIDFKVCSRQVNTLFFWSYILFLSSSLERPLFTHALPSSPWGAGGEALSQTYETIEY